MRREGYKASLGGSGLDFPGDDEGRACVSAVLEGRVKCGSRSL